MSSYSSNTHFSTSPRLGVDFYTTTASSDAQFDLGEVVHGTDGTEWVYVQASGAITQYDAVAIDENFQAAALTKALADDNHRIGFAQVAFADNENGWIAVRGKNIQVRVRASCAADTGLYTTTTAGILDDSNTSQTKVEGAVIITAATGTGVQAEEVLATYPYTASAA